MELIEFRARTQEYIDIHVKSTGELATLILPQIIDRVTFGGGYEFIKSITNVVCEDGKQRTVRFNKSGPDTFFSHPGQTKVKGKWVSGFVTCEKAYPSDQEIYVFITYRYGKNAHLIIGEELSTYGKE